MTLIAVCEVLKDNSVTADSKLRLGTSLLNLFSEVKEPVQRAEESAVARRHPLHDRAMFHLCLNSVITTVEVTVMETSLTGPTVMSNHQL